MLIIIIIFATIVLLSPSFRAYFLSASKIKRYILGFGYLAPIIYLFLYTVRSFLFVFPVAVFCLLGSWIFGPYLGFLYAMVGAFLSSTLGYFLGKYLFKDFFSKYINQKLNNTILKDVKPFNIALSLRLMLLPYDLLNFALGAWGIGYKDFILSTLIGLLPEYIVYAYLGSLGSHGHIPLKYRISISLIMFGILASGYYIAKKLKKKYNVE